jgi:hypothetical protein
MMHLTTAGAGATQANRGTYPARAYTFSEPLWQPATM